MNVYDYSFDLAEKQKLTGEEMILLGELFSLTAKYHQIPLDRHNIILEHIKLVNLYLLEETKKSSSGNLQGSLDD